MGVGGLVAVLPYPLFFFSFWTLYVFVWPRQYLFINAAVFLWRENRHFSQIAQYPPTPNTIRVKGTWEESKTKVYNAVRKVTRIKEIEDITSREIKTGESFFLYLFQTIFLKGYIQTQVSQSLLRWRDTN